jgi:hypothetical protein
MRAPAPSLMKTKGVPVSSAARMHSVISWAVPSPTEPPATVKSWEAASTGRPSTSPTPVTTPSPGRDLSAMPKAVQRWVTNRPCYWKESRS